MHTVTAKWFERVYSDPLYLTLYEQADTKAARSEARQAHALLGAAEGCRWLDVGCGFGRHAEVLSELGCHVTGLDLSALMTARAADRARERRLPIHYVRGDMAYLPFHTCFDVASCFFDSFGYQSRNVDHLDTLLAMARVLQTGGRLLIQLTNREHLVRTWPPAASEQCGDFRIDRTWWLDLAAGRYGWQQSMSRGSVVSHWELDLRLFTAAEISALARQSGFTDCKLYGNLQGQKYGLDSTHLVLVARKAALEDIPALSS